MIQNKKPLLALFRFQCLSEVLLVFKYRSFIGNAGNDVVMVTK